jgi:hypothetical protein
MRQRYLLSVWPPQQWHRQWGTAQLLPPPPATCSSSHQGRQPALHSPSRRLPSLSPTPTSLSNISALRSAWRTARPPHWSEARCASSWLARLGQVPSLAAGPGCSSCRHIAHKHSHRLLSQADPRAQTQARSPHLSTSTDSMEHTSTRIKHDINTHASRQLGRRWGLAPDTSARCPTKRSTSDPIKIAAVAWTQLEGSITITCVSGCRHKRVKLASQRPQLLQLRLITCVSSQHAA